MGHLYCKICGQSFQTRANCKQSVTLYCCANSYIPDLTEPVDIFADWIDSSEAASKLATQRGGPISPIVASAGAGPSRAPRNGVIDEGDEQEAPRRRFVQADSDEDD